MTFPFDNICELLNSICCKNVFTYVRLKKSRLEREYIAVLFYIITMALVTCITRFTRPKLSSFFFFHFTTVDSNF